MGGVQACRLGPLRVGVSAMPQPHGVGRLICASGVRRLRASGVTASSGGASRRRVVWVGLASGVLPPVLLGERIGRLAGPGGSGS
jgi:hypothetical protein